MRTRWCVSVLVLVLLWIGCGAKVPPSPPRRTNLGLPIHTFRIENNGLRVVVVPDPKASQVQVTMQYLVGSIDDPAGREGMAHLVEHLMFLPVVGSGQTLFARLEAAAPWFNALTGLETTSYASRADPSRLPDLLQIEGLRLGVGCKTLTEEAFARERDVVRNELRQRADPIRGALFAALYPEDHLYRRPVGGDEASLGRITREEACAFIDAHYSPDNAVLIVSGNVTTEALDAALAKLLGRVAKHQTSGHPSVAPIARRAPTSAKLPLEEPVAVVAWPLPDDPAMRARVRAVAAMMALHINPEIKGTIHVREYGAGRAPAIAFLIAPGRDEALEAAVVAAEHAALAMQVWFRSESFENARSRAVYRLYARFEDGLERDALLADHVFAGRDPVQGLGAEIQALNRLSANEARQIVGDRFAFANATIVRLEPEAARKAPALGKTAAPAVASTAAPADLDPQIHRPGDPRIVADPAAAHAEARRASERDPLAGIRERTLANGMRVILMPLTSVPTVDVRLVFGAGTIDEPVRQRGVALFAAHALAPRREHALVLRAFYTTGGILDVDVETEHTTFAARGLDMYVDVLLATLERLVRNGEYVDLDSRAIMRGFVGKLGAADTAQDLWRDALYGAAHPYASADDWRRANFDALDRGALKKFRSTHFRPGSATLIVAGGFDPAVAEPWIDYLFGDWEGKASPAARPNERARLKAVALAKHDDTKQVAVNIALPIDGAGGRAASMVAAEMIDTAIADVRTQLGASYGLHASLAESRLATHIRITGLVDAERAKEALVLVRDRIGRLAAGDDVAASLFVAARRDVMARLSSTDSGAYALASLAELAVDLGRPLTADLTTAEDARKLTLARMAGTLGAIDLARAAILLGGPRDAVTRAFAALGRTPRVVN